MSWYEDMLKRASEIDPSKDDGGELLDVDDGDHVVGIIPDDQKKLILLAGQLESQADGKRFELTALQMKNPREVNHADREKLLEIVSEITWLEEQAACLMTVVSMSLGQQYPEMRGKCYGFRKNWQIAWRDEHDHQPLGAIVISVHDMRQKAATAAPMPMMHPHRNGDRQTDD